MKRKLPPLVKREFSVIICDRTGKHLKRLRLENYSKTNDFCFLFENKLYCFVIEDEGIPQYWEYGKCLTTLGAIQKAFGTEDDNESIEELEVETEEL